MKFDDQTFWAQVMICTTILYIFILIISLAFSSLFEFPEGLMEFRGINMKNPRAIESEENWFGFLLLLVLPVLFVCIALISFVFFVKNKDVMNGFYFFCCFFSFCFSTFFLIRGMPSDLMLYPVFYESRMEVYMAGYISIITYSHTLSYMVFYITRKVKKWIKI